MKRTVLLFAIVVALTAVASASDAMKAIVSSYLQIHAALAADKTDGVKAAAEEIASQAGRMGTSGAAIEKAARTMAAAADLKAARTALGPLSDAVIAAGKAEDWKDVTDVKVAYCPMVRQSWLQKGDKIKNPYYGSSMSTCGDFKK